MYDPDSTASERSHATCKNRGNLARTCSLPRFTVVSLQSRFASSRFAANISRFAAHVKSIRYNLSPRPRSSTSGTSSTLMPAVQGSYWKPAPTSTAPQLPKTALLGAKSTLHLVDFLQTKSGSFRSHHICESHDQLISTLSFNYLIFNKVYSYLTFGKTG